jgi:hypothetical protein
VQALYIAYDMYNYARHGNSADPARSCTAAVRRLKRFSVLRFSEPLSPANGPRLEDATFTAVNPEAQLVWECSDTLADITFETEADTGRNSCEPECSELPMGVHHPCCSQHCPLYDLAANGLPPL